jgi:hypothetical protein
MAGGELEEELIARTGVAARHLREAREILADPRSGLWQVASHLEQGADILGLIRSQAQPGMSGLRDAMRGFRARLGEAELLFQHAALLNRGLADLHWPPGDAYGALGEPRGETGFARQPLAEA